MRRSKVVVGAGAASSHPPSRSAAPARPGAGSRRCSASSTPRPPWRTSASAPRASDATSWTARFSPLAPVGGTMCAASPARNSRPCCIGSRHERAHRRDALLEDRARRADASSSAARTGSQLVPDPVVRPVVDAARRAATCRYSRDTSANACECSAKPRSCEAVDELVGDRRGLGQDAEPRERILALVRRSARRPGSRRGRRRGSRRSRRRRRSPARAAPVVAERDARRVAGRCRRRATSATSNCSVAAGRAARRSGP